MAHRSLRLRPVASWVLAFAAVGCISGGRVKSGVDPSKKLAQTTKDERIAVCQADVRYRYIVTSGTLRCRAVAIAIARGNTDSELRASCAAAFDSCQTGDGVPGQNLSAELENCAESLGDWTAYFGCKSARVFQLEDCASDQRDEFSMRLNELSACRSITVSERIAYETAIAPAQIESCRALYELCF